jgi:3'-phosphoadenosine 5'-phosphosulfate (PAPS) 3'-phosphatase
MNLTSDNLRQLRDSAVAAARAAERCILASRPAEIRYKESGQSKAASIVTEIDRQSQAAILSALAPTLSFFDLAVLSEERDDDGERLRKDFFWCIDPIDGTLPFVEDRPGFAVSIALVSRSGTPILGVVIDPARRRLYSAVRGQGLFVDDRPWSPPAPSKEVLSVYADLSLGARADFAEIECRLQACAEESGLSRAQLHFGSGAVMNACHVLEHPPACYFKLPRREPGGGSLWDFAATTCLFAEAGCIAGDMDGRALELNRRDSTFLNHRGVLFATDAALAGRISALRAL